MRSEALDMMKKQEEVIRKMRRQLENMSVKEIDREATEKRIFENEGKRVQKATRAAAKSALNDRMEAYKGVRMVKYKSVPGFNVNILEKRNGSSVLIDAQKFEGADRKRHRFRHERSKLTASYWGASRSFVLRIQEHGTQSRTAGTRYSSKGGSGNRGAITAKDYMSTARDETQRAADNIVRQLSFIEQLFMKE